MIKEKSSLKIIKFDEEKYLQQGIVTYGRRTEVELLAKEVAKTNYENVYLLGIGGTEFSFAPFAYFADRKSKIDFIPLSAGVLMVSWPKHLDKNSLVISSSISGTTEEICKAVEYLANKGIDVVSFAPSDSKLANLSKAVIKLDTSEGSTIEHVTLLETFFIYGFLYARGEFEDYPEYVDQLKNIFCDLVEIRKSFDSKAAEIAKNIYNAPYTIVTGSGSLWSETLMFSMCFLEEMQWVRTRPVQADRFFHGTLELVQPDVPVIIIKNVDENRVLDTRVEEFCRKINANYYVIDPAEYSISGLNPKFRELISHWIVCVLLDDRLSAHYEDNTKHDMNFRRYYRQFEY